LNGQLYIGYRTGPCDTTFIQTWGCMNDPHKWMIWFVKQATTTVQ